MLDIKERVLPGISANYLLKESLSRYLFFRKFIKSGWKILDLGCGVGYGLYEIIDSETGSYGVDIDSESIKYARENYKNIIFDVGNAESINYPDNYFDAICCFEVIEHLKDPKKMLKEVKRVLKNNGTFVISTPNIKIHSSKNIENPYHLREYNLDDFRKLLLKYFPDINLYGQFKSKRFYAAYDHYLKSQKVRQKFVNNDILNIRRLLPKLLKERIWKLLGAFFGRSAQSNLETKDFPIRKSNIEKGEYFVGLCVKRQ